MKLFFLCFFLSHSYLFSGDSENPMTLEEKVGQLLIVHFHGTEANEEARRLIQEGHVGGFIYYNWCNGLDSPEQVRQLSKGLQSLATIPLWLCLDQEGGPVRRLQEGFDYTRGNREVAGTGNPDTAEEEAYRVGMMLKDVGINMNLAPVADVSTHPETSYIAARTYGDDPEIVIRFAEKALRGYRRAHILPVLKHFPGYGEARADPHARLPVVAKARQELDQVELQPFKVLAPNAEAVMTAHLMVPALDPIRCATLSKPIIQGILRGEMEFDGLVLSDSLVMEGVLAGCAGIEEAAILAIDAGCDLLILGGKILIGEKKGAEISVDDALRIHNAIFNAFKSRRLSERRLDESLNRILRLKQKYLNDVS